MEDLRQEIMKLEFQHKKDIAEADRRFDERFDRMQILVEETKVLQKQTQVHLNHLTKLIGVSFEKFADIESRIENAANALHPKVESK